MASIDTSHPDPAVSRSASAHSLTVTDGSYGFPDLAQLRNRTAGGACDATLAAWYPGDVPDAKQRIARLTEQFAAVFAAPATGPFFVVSVPGRTELAGNHTDHNNGRVLAGAVNLDSLALVRRRSDRRVTVLSVGYPEPFEPVLDVLDPIAAERGTTTAMIRGVARALVDRGYQIGGFEAVVESRVLPGSGLSSSASIEVVFAAVFSLLYNGGRVSPVEMALAGRFAENEFFGKPCGLMDQLACAHGGVIGIDFLRPTEPLIEPVDVAFEESGYRLLVVDTGGNHADLTADYADVPLEMRRVAAYFERQQLRDVTEEQVLGAISKLRTAVGDRAVLRAIHYFAENTRVGRQIAALSRRDFREYLRLVAESGASSRSVLQNCYSTQIPADQGLNLALALSERLLATNPADPNTLPGVARVHGGGFAGTIQVYVAQSLLEQYVVRMQDLFGPHAVTLLQIRPVGAACLGASTVP